MPYKIIGTNVYHKKNGVWSIKQHAKSVKNAKATVRLLYSLERRR